MAAPLSSFLSLNVRCSLPLILAVLLSRFEEGWSFFLSVPSVPASETLGRTLFGGIQSRSFPKFALDTSRQNFAPGFRPRSSRAHNLFCSTSPMEVVVVGSCNADLVACAPRLPQKGETITGTRSEMLHGGKGANQAVMASRMGASVAMVACVGDDPFGASYLENLSQNKVDCRSVRTTSDAATGVAQICVDDSGANFIVVVPGANYHLTPEDVADAGMRLQGAKVMLCQGEVRRETTLKALELGRAEGMVTLFNPAPAMKDLPDRFLEVSDVVCPNETELALLCKGDIDPSSDKSVHTGARELIARGARNVIVTLGSRGSMYVSSKSEGFKVFPADKVSAVDTVGAGDAFIGALGAYLSRGVSLEDAIGKAIRVASTSVTRAGAQPSYPTASELPLDLRLP